MFSKIGLCHCLSQGSEITKETIPPGCVLSPLLFNIFLADIQATFDQCGDSPLLNGQDISCLIWADDILILSKSEEGLQQKLDSLGTYCKKNKIFYLNGKVKFNLRAFNFSTKKCFSSDETFFCSHPKNFSKFQTGLICIRLSAGFFSSYLCLQANRLSRCFSYCLDLEQRNLFKFDGGLMGCTMFLCMKVYVKSVMSFYRGTFLQEVLKKLSYEFSPNFYVVFFINALNE